MPAKPTNVQLARMNGNFRAYFTLNPDFLIVGAGVMGLSAAWELAAAGACVTVIERGEAPGRESSWAGGGILSALLPWQYPQAVTSLIDLSTALYPAWTSELHAASAIDTEYRKTGVLVLPPFDECSAKTWKSTQPDVSADLVCARDVGGPFCADERALWLRDAAQVRNPRLMKALLAASKRQGVQILTGAEVREIQVAGDRVARVITRQTTFTPGNVVVAAGAWSGKLVEGLGARMNIFPVRGQMLLYQDHPDRLKTILLQND
jgi:glycine oxidase